MTMFSEPDITVRERPIRSGGLRRWLTEAAGTAAMLVLAAVLGANATSHTTLVFVVVMLVAALALIDSRPTTWIALAVAAPWVSRLLTVAGPAPRVLDFASFPLVLVAFTLASLRYLQQRRRITTAQRRILQWLLVAAGVMAVSWAFNDLNEPLRLVAAWVLELEPFLLLGAIILTPMTQRQRRMLLVVTATMLCGQLLFSLAQIASGQVGDQVKGTLLAAGAGHHVSAGGLALGFCVLATQRVPKALVAVFGALALFVIVVADAKQVLFVLPLALLVLGMSGRKHKTGASLFGGVLLGASMAAASVYALINYQASSTAFTFIDRSTTQDTGKVAVAQALWTDVTSSPSAALFGLGPGESVSRLAFLTTEDQLKAGSPVGLLGLHVSRGADHYDHVAYGGAHIGHSSFTGALSSAMGIFGDYGIAGALAFGALITAVLVALLRKTDRRLRASALAGWAMLLPLAVVFGWLEQPPFVLPVMVLTGLALRTDAGDDTNRVAAGSSPSTRRKNTTSRMGEVRCG